MIIKTKAKADGALWQAKSVLVTGLHASKYADPPSSSLQHPDYPRLLGLFLLSQPGRLAMRACDGVTSTTSSSLMYSTMASSDISCGGVSPTVMPLVALRIFVRSFILHTLIWCKGALLCYVGVPKLFWPSESRSRGKRRQEKGAVYTRDGGVSLWPPSLVL